MLSHYHWWTTGGSIGFCSAPEHVRDQLALVLHESDQVCWYRSAHTAECRPISSADMVAILTSYAPQQSCSSRLRR
jgi:hypothetical protein